MARNRIRNGETTTDAIVLGNNDRLLIEAGGTLRTGASPAVTLDGADILARNLGLVETADGDGPAIAGDLSGAIDVKLRNGATGVIRADDTAIDIESADDTTGRFVLFNQGTIDGRDGKAVDLSGLSATGITILNGADGVMTNSGDSDVLRPGNDTLSAIRVANHGQIVAGTLVGETSGGDGVDLQSNDGGVSATIVNYQDALIEGGKHGVTGKNEAFIRNLEGGEIIGRNGSGLNFDTSADDGDSAVIVRNHGLISGRYDGFGEGDGDGVDVDYLVDIRNTGRIEGAGADNVDNFGDGVAAGGGRIVNLAGGEIFGETHGILIDDGDRNGAYAETQVINHGTISSDLGTAVRLIGEFDDRIVNDGAIEGGGRYAIEAGGGDDNVSNTGSIDGDVDLGAGDDIFHNTGSVDGEIFGGGGSDTFFAGSADEVFAYSDVTDSGIGAADRIVGFASGDRIDLSAIDADTATDGDQAFTAIGDAAFSGTAGELRVEEGQTATFVSGDVDGDGNADFSIVLAGPVDPAIVAFDL